jgi:hypothetical protein
MQPITSKQGPGFLPWKISAVMVSGRLLMVVPACTEMSFREPGSTVSPLKENGCALVLGLDAGMVSSGNDCFGK